ncbi:helix-turn-helix transcriptional regulator [Vibrio ishigakensis]|uniref:helix-turn-helix transcriptional regulator n=1 Tax=Vibrio ishigakensis TaxID=1481914 RepID=UPI0021C35C15|nr:LuxR C-terminal-related transcriptional regulator [Vibrio ishigakensis]
MPEISFEALLTQQVDALMSSKPAEFESTFRDVALQALQWFNLDRMTLFPNSMILLNDGKSISVSRQGIPELDKTKYVVGNYKGYLKLLRHKREIQTFNSDQLATSGVGPLEELYKDGGRWHGIIRLELFGQLWGALAFSRFSEGEHDLNQEEVRRLKLLCDTWLVYWQHSTITRSLRQTAEQQGDESEKLLRLSKKQCTVLALLAQGLTAKQCAEKLFLSPRTIESHKYRMLDLLDLENHTELVQFALRNGLGIEAS